MFLYTSFSLLPFIMNSQSIPSSLQSGRGTLRRCTEYPLIFCTGLVQAVSKKNPLGLEEGVFFSVNNNSRKNTRTGLLEELDRISEFHCSCFLENRVFILAICLGRGWNKPQLATVLSYQCLLCYWQSMFLPTATQIPSSFLCSLKAT